VPSPLLEPAPQATSRRSSRLIDNRPTGVKLGIVLGAALACVAVVCAVGFVELARATTQADRLQALQRLTRVTLEADMAHDAIRGDVQQVMLSGPGAAESAEAAAEFEEHQAIITDGVDRFRKPDVPDDVRAAAEAVAPIVVGYVAEGRDLVGRGQRTQVRAADIGAFREAFTAVEDGLPTVGDALDAEVTKAADAVAAAHRSATITLLAVAVGAALLLLVLGRMLTRSIVQPLRRVSEVSRALATGDLTLTCDLHRRDEFGAMASDLDTAIGSLRGMVGELTSTGAALGTAAGELSRVSGDLHSGARDAASRADEARAATTEVDQSVQSVMAGSTQMAASVAEIATNAQRAADVAQESVAAAGRADEHITALASASAEIDGVVKLITSIAEQTNLLALNATIEAARAGAAGKGFAVVADEVKQLAQETARATGDITERIGTLRTTSTAAADAVGAIRGVIEQINEFSMLIAAAVEEQAATTSDMSRSLGVAASGSTEVIRVVTAVAEVGEATTEGARASKEAADDVARYAEALQGLVHRFTV
jgi:methyl-accepting chemotaxis protein